jgi:hypothetical protein
LSCWVCIADCHEKLNAILIPLMSATETELSKHRRICLCKGQQKGGFMERPDFNGLSYHHAILGDPPILTGTRPCQVCIWTS